MKACAKRFRPTRNRGGRRTWAPRFGRQSRSGSNPQATIDPPAHLADLDLSLYLPSDSIPLPTSFRHYQPHNFRASCAHPTPQSSPNPRLRPLISNLGLRTSDPCPTKPWRRRVRPLSPPYPSTLRLEPGLRQHRRQQPPRAPDLPPRVRIIPPPAKLLQHPVPLRMRRLPPPRLLCRCGPDRLRLRRAGACVQGRLPVRRTQTGAALAWGGAGVGLKIFDVTTQRYPASVWVARMGGLCGRVWVDVWVFDHRISGCPSRFTADGGKRRTYSKPLKTKGRNACSGPLIGSGGGIFRQRRTRLRRGTHDPASEAGL
jgi:hypothetical protein